ncbi:hypothetical protein BV20DRAFT_675293 [Pilatotrama ljubarskyi]|nr:hypothetical protein BV20DRAFT_675293 [Pilatotrama ljubarskyi]
MPPPTTLTVLEAVCPQCSALTGGQRLRRRPHHVRTIRKLRDTLQHGIGVYCLRRHSCECPSARAAHSMSTVDRHIRHNSQGCLPTTYILQQSRRSESRPGENSADRRGHLRTARVEKAEYIRKGESIGTCRSSGYNTQAQQSHMASSQKRQWADREGKEHASQYTEGNGCSRRQRGV